MSLDKNLFTLMMAPNAEDPRVVDLIDPSGVVHYRKQRIAGPVYKIEVYDPMAESLLITASAPSATSKVKTLELYNPTTVVEMKYAGTLSFRWAFKWEEHEFEWKREECYMIRKPDPPVLVAVTKEPPGRIKTSAVQILDYNLNRFDIEDRKGLEIVILTALLTFQDSSDTIHSRDGSGSVTPSNQPTPGTSQRASSNAIPPPPPPPKPHPKTGVDRIAELQAMRGEINEVTVEDEGSVNAYADYCWNLLQDEAMLFITVRSSKAEHVPKVLQVVHETKRLRHKAGLDEDELHQYVVYDTVSSKGPKRINLDDKVKDKYAPPESIIIHLSKIPMPELQPKIVTPDTIKESKSEDKAKTKDDKGKKKYENKAPSPPRANKLKRNNSSGSSSSPARLNVHSSQTHPRQPSPSPSQLNNPGIYVAPPPKTNAARPPKPHTLNIPIPTLSPRPNSFHGGDAPQETAAAQPGSSAQKMVAGIFDKFSLRLR